MEYTFITHVLLLVIFFVVSIQANVIHYDMNDAENIFKKFVEDFQKSYKDKEDEDVHFEYFKENLQVINDLNDKYNPDTTFGVNRFTDLSKEEMRQWFNGIG